MEELTEAQSRSASKTDDMVFKTKEEYFVALQKWLHDAHLWQSTMSCLPYFMLSHPELAGTIPGGTSDPSRRPLFAVSTPTVQNTGTTTAHAGGIRCRIPPFWKRFCAEILDSAIMFLLKLFVTFIAINVFDLIDLDQYSLEMLQQNVQSLTYKLAVEMTSQLLVLELINRIVVCILEAYWLRGGEGGRLGGATPGKSLMGLRVVLCLQVLPIAGQPQHIVVVSPGSDLGWGWAFTRAIAKNIFLALVYPLCFAFFFFKHNRLGYDILSHSIVVEVDNHH